VHISHRLRDPVLGYLGSWGYFWGYLASSCAKSDIVFLLCDHISYKGDEISRLSCLVIEIRILGYFGGFRGFGGIQLPPMQNLTSCSCSPTPISYRGDEISRVKEWDLMWDRRRQTTDNRQTWRPKQKALTISASLISWDQNYLTGPHTAQL